MRARLYHRSASAFSIPAMIKLELLLRRPAADPVLDPAVRTLLEQHGLRVTGAGRASVSAQLTEAAFAALFGKVDPNAELMVPAPLADAISVAAIAPRHCVTHHPFKARHAAL